MKKIGAILLAVLVMASCDLIVNKDPDPMSFLLDNDIEISAIKAPLVATQGELVTVNVTVKNSGTENVEEQIEITLVNQTEGITIGTKTLGDGLASNDSATVSYSWDTGDLVFGEHILVARHTFEDSNIANDSLMSTLEIIQPNVVDIAISAINLPDPIVKGEIVNAEVVIKNNGNKDVSDAITMKLNDLTDGTTIGSQTIEGGLANGNSKRLTFGWDTRGYSAGNHELAASHNFTDGNPANDLQTTKVTINEPPFTDIAIAEITGPSSITQGEDVELTIRLKNEGNQDVGSAINVTLVDQYDGRTIGSLSLKSGLNVGASGTLTFNWNTGNASIGNHTMLASHDLNDEKAGNDSKSMTIRINEPTILDIAITDLDAPGSVERGDKVTIKVTLRNQGNSDVKEAITVTLFDQTYDVTVGTETLNKGMKKGTAATLKFTWNTKKVKKGDHRFAVTHDYTDSNAANNTRSFVIDIED